MGSEVDYDQLMNEEEQRLTSNARGAGQVDYGALIDEETQRDQAQKNQRLAASLQVAVDKNPDQAAKQSQLASRAGIPAAAVETFPDDIARRQRVSELMDLAKTSPVLADQLSDPRRAALMHDDAENLSAIERITRTYLGASAKSGVESLLGVGARLADALNPFTLSEQDAAVLYKNDPAKLREFKREHPAMYLSRFAEAMQQASERTMQNISPDAQAAYGELKYATLDPSKAAYLSPVKVIGDAIQSLPTSLALAASIYFTKGAATQAESRALAAGATQEAARVEAMKTAAVTMAKLSAASEGAVGFAQQANQTRSAADNVEQAKLETSPEYQKLIAAGFSPEAARTWLSATAATQSGIGAGVADAIVAFFGGKYLGRLIGEGGSFVPRVLRGAGIEAGTEAAQSGLEQTAQNLALKANINPTQDVLDGVVENIVQGFFVGGLTGGVFSGAAGRAKRAENAVRDAKALGVVDALTAQSKLKARDPEAFGEFAQQVTGEDGAVYVDARAFVEALHQSGVDAQELAKVMPSVREQLEQAVATKGDLQIPVAEYAARIAGTDAGKALLPHLRTQPDGMSEAEARQFFQDENTAQALQADVQRFTEEARATDANMRQGTEAVRQHLVQALQAAGRFTPEVNTAYSQLAASFYGAMSQRLGQSAEQLLQRYPLHVVADLGVSPQSMLAQAAYHGSPHDFTKFSADKIGTGEGAQAYGHGLYFAENPDVARSYQRALSDHQVIVNGESVVPKPFYGLRSIEDQALAWVQSAVDAQPQDPFQYAKQQARSILGKNSSVADDIVAQITKWQEQGARIAGGGSLYQVHIADEAIGRMLDWHKQLSEQAPAVRQALESNELVRKILDANAAARDAALKRAGSGATEVTHRAIGNMSQANPTGAQLYFALAKELGGQAAGYPEGVTQHNQAAASQLLTSLGIPGIKYLDQASRATGEGTRNLVVFDDSLVTITHKDGKPLTPAERAAYLQATRGNTRGAFDPNTHTIALLKNADLSTFIHESGHFYLEVLTDLAVQPGTPAQVREDAYAVMRWLGVSDLAAWRAMTLEQKREAHEKFARGFEAYVFEGEAPSLELRGAFARFRAWLINVYRSLTALNVELNDEVRAVFDRMLATDEQISAAEISRGYRPLFESAQAAGMTAQQWEEYQRTGMEATAEARATLERRSLQDMRWLANAKSRKLKELQAQAAEKRKATEAEVRAELAAKPIYQAMRWLKTGELPTGEKTVGAKLDLAALKDLYGDGPAALWRYLPTGERGLAGAEGLHPDVVAEMFGFTSGDELVRELVAAGSFNTAVEARTDQRMLERYGDLNNRDTLERAAEAAIHNEARARFVAAELNALQKTTRPARVMAQAAKQFAEASIAQKKIRAIKPGQYETAEARAARAALHALKAGKLAEAAAEKRAQLVNHQLAAVAEAALEEIDKSVAYLKRFDTEASRKGLDSDYVEQIHQLLERFDLRVSVSNKDLEKRRSLRDWLDSQREQGLEPVIDETLLDEAQRRHYREMPLEEFRGLVDAVKNIEHLGRLKKKLLTAKGERDFAARADEAAQAIKDNAKRTLPVELERNTWASKFKHGAAEFFAMHRKFASFWREMDGHKDGGKLWELFVRPMNEAGNREAVMREQATVKLAELFKPILKAGKLREKLYIPAIRASLSREGRIMVALNTGNAGNLQRLMDGDRWTAGQVTAIVETLSKEEWDFVQGVWDHLESYRAEVGAQQKRLTGIEPEWVEPTPVVTRFGTYRGGYLPAKYDSARSTRSLADEAAQNIMDQWRAVRGRPKARDSFVKGRADKVTNRPLRKDFGVITQHVTEVTHRLAWQDYLTDASRLLRAEPIDSAIRDHYGAEVLGALRDTVEDIAAGEIAAQNAFESAMSYLRHGATIAGLGWRLTTALLQPLGLTQSIVRIGPKYVGRGLAEWLGDAARMENTAKRIYEKSDFMRLRGKTLQREISEIRNKVSGSSSAIEASYFYLIQKLQLVADIPTWLGQYHKAIEAGADEATAIAQSDQAVLDAQGSGQIKDLAAIQRGSPLLKLFTNFYSFFNTTYNLTAESVSRTKFTNPLSVGRLAVDMLLLYSVPAALATLMKAALKGDTDDEDKLLRQLIADQLTYLFGTMVGLREAAGAVQTTLGLPGDYRGPASVRVFSALASLGQQVGQGEADAAFWKSLNETAGILFHYPAGQINATAEGFYGLATGETQNPGALVVGPKH